jgi:hypothetical protein
MAYTVQHKAPVVITGFISKAKARDVPSLKTFVQGSKALNYAPGGSGPEDNTAGPYFKTVLLPAEGPVPQNPQGRFAAAIREDDIFLFKPFRKGPKAPVFKTPAFQGEFPRTEE